MSVTADFVRAKQTETAGAHKLPAQLHKGREEDRAGEYLADKAAAAWRRPEAVP